MTQPPQPPWDTGNPLIQAVPAILKTGLLRCPDGVERLVLTIYQPAGETTVLLEHGDAAAWIANLTRTHAAQSKVTLAAQIPGQVPLPNIPNVPLPNMPGNGRHPPGGGGSR